MRGLDLRVWSSSLDFDRAQAQEKWHFLIGHVLGFGTRARRVNFVRGHLLYAVNHQAAICQPVDVVLQGTIDVYPGVPGPRVENGRGQRPLTGSHVQNFFIAEA